MKRFKYIIIIVLLSFAVVAAQDSNLSNMYRLAKTFEESGEFEQAKKIYEDIYKAQPWNITFIEALNNIYLLLKEYDKSIELMTEKIKSEPANINFYGLLGNTYYIKGDTAKAYQTWDDGINASDQSFVSYRVIVNNALQNRAFGKAIEYLERAKKIDKNSDIFALDLARVYSMTMNFAKAAEEYCGLIKEQPSMGQVVIRTMMQYLNRPEAVEETIATVEKISDREDEPELYRVLVQLYQLNNDYKKALTAVEELERSTKSEGKEYFKFAQQALTNDQSVTASKAFKRLIEEYPNSPLVPPSRIGYAKSFERSLDNKRDSLIQHWKPYSKPEVLFEEEYINAIESFQEISKLYPNNDIQNEALFRIAEIYFNKLNQPEKAMEYYNRILNSKAVSQLQIESKLKLAEIFVKAGKLKSAEDEIREALINFNLPDNLKSKANLLLGKVYFWEGKFKAASEKLAEVSKNLFDDNANDALQLITLVNTLKNDSTSLANYAEAELSAYQQKFTEASIKFKELKESKNPIISELAGFKYAQVLVAQNNYAEALAVLSETAEKSSLKMFNPDIEFLKGEIKYYALKDYEGALESYRNILESYGNSLYFDKSREKIEYINQMKKKTI